MSSLTVFILFICIIAILFLILNLFLAPHNSYSEKMSVFECGFHSFLQTRSPFSVSFFIYGLLYLIFDLEILLIYPYALSSYVNNLYGLVIVLIFTITLTIGFVFEIGKNALRIESKQLNLSSKKSTKIISLFGKSLGQHRNYSVLPSKGIGSSSNSPVKVYDNVLNDKTQIFSRVAEHALK